MIITLERFAQLAKEVGFDFHVDTEKTLMQETGKCYTTQEVIQIVTSRLLDKAIKK